MDYTVKWYMDDIHDDGRVFEIEVNRFLVCDTRAKAFRIARKALAFDETRSKFKLNRVRPRVFKSEADGGWMATYGGGGEK